MSGGGARVALVTGRGRGIGRASALRLARDGRHVVVADLGESGADAVREVAGLGVRASFVQTDVTDASAVQATVAQVEREHGRLDILVNCAGILGLEAPFAEQTDELWHRVLAINLTGVWNCCRAALPIMRRQGYGRIVTISSNARRGAPNVAPYAVSKAGVVALTRSIAAAYARENVFANCVEPSRTLTDMVVPRSPSEFLANPPGTPIGRYADPTEVASVVNVLCSEENTYVSGAVYRVSGGTP